MTRIAGFRILGFQIALIHSSSIPSLRNFFHLNIYHTSLSMRFPADAGTDVRSCDVCSCLFQLESALICSIRVIRVTSSNHFKIPCLRHCFKSIFEYVRRHGYLPQPRIHPCAFKSDDRCQRFLILPYFMFHRPFSEIA